MKKLLLMFGLAICLAIGLSLAEAYADETAWNGGYCSKCGNSYKLSGVSHIKNGGDLFYYACDECGDTIRTHHSMK